jgi:hypothetical protein
MNRIVEYDVVNEHVFRNEKYIPSPQYIVDGEHEKYLPSEAEEEEGNYYSFNLEMIAEICAENYLKEERDFPENHPLTFFIWINDEYKGKCEVWCVN